MGRINPQGEIAQCNEHGGARGIAGVSRQFLSFGTYFPWSLLLPTTVLIAWRRRKLPQIRFAMAAVAGPWLLMEMVKTKLPFYILPAYPALAFLTADTLVRCMRGQFKELASKAFIIGLTVWALAAVAIGFSPWLILLMQKQLPLPRLAMTAFHTERYSTRGL